MPPLILFSHELFHAYQFDQGEISLGEIGSKGRVFLLDKTDELAGYIRQSLFGSDEGVSSINTLPDRYNQLPTGPINVKNYTIGGQSISQMNRYERVHLAKLTNQAYRFNGQTIVKR